MKNLKPYAKFFFETGILMRTPRAGFRHLGEWRQSVAEHLLRTSYIGYTLAHLENSPEQPVDIPKVVACCLFHDFGEARSIDLDYISQKYSKSDERKAVEDGVQELAFGSDILAAFDEIETLSTREGIIAKDADQLELLCTLKEIIDNGNTLAKEWIPSTLKRFRTESARLLAQEILTTSSDEWWFAEKQDEYWITGGKNHN